MKIYQLSETTPQKIQMMGYVFDDEKGHIAVMDGGNYGDGAHLLDMLKHITGQEKPHIDTWLMTHPHSDHVDAFRWMLDMRRGLRSPKPACLPAVPIQSGWSSIFLAMIQRSWIGSEGILERTKVLQWHFCACTWGNSFRMLIGLYILMSILCGGAMYWNLRDFLMRLRPYSG